MDHISDVLQSVGHRWIEVGWRQPNAEAFRLLHAEEFIDHSAAGRQVNRKGFWEGVISLYAAFPDLKAVVDDLIIAAQRRMVTIRWSAVGTHRGAYFGIKPTGREIHFTGIEIIRIEDGLVRERWGEWNGTEIIEQMGQPPTAAVLARVVDPMSALRT